MTGARSPAVIYSLLFWLKVWLISWKSVWPTSATMFPTPFSAADDGDFLFAAPTSPLPLKELGDATCGAR